MGTLPWADADDMMAIVVLLVCAAILAVAFWGLRLIIGWLWRHVFHRGAKPDTEAYLREISPREFEEYMTQLFIIMGYNATLTPETNDGGKDIVLERDGVTCYVECKQWERDAHIGRPELQKLAGAAALDSVENILFVATCRYADTAIDAAEKSETMHVELWGMDDIMANINEAKRLTGVKRIAPELTD
ncbi:MAG: restriction endonuclease [Schwartzia sp.]|nr:restriction endonuclease [Schwartzia sp. (in: firmicutes)]